MIMDKLSLLDDEEMDLLITALLAHINQCYKFLNNSNNLEEINFLQDKIKRMKRLSRKLYKEA